MQPFALGAVDSSRHTTPEDSVHLSYILYIQKERGQAFTLGGLQAGATTESSNQNECSMASSSHGGKGTTDIKL